MQSEHRASLSSRLTRPQQLLKPNQVEVGVDKRGTALANTRVVWG
jgi:hypothetical protein